MSDKKDFSYLLDIIKLAEAGEKNTDFETLKINFKGFLNENNSISKINLNLAYLFSKDSSYDVSISPLEIEGNYPAYYESLSNNFNKKMESFDFIISHTENPLFKVPNSSHWILFQNWGYGSIPVSWKENLRDYVDQIWVSSNYEKDCYIESGISDKLITVINTAIDSAIFNSNVEKTDIGTNKKVKFLYKGDLTYNSGFDLLLKAYSEEFIKDEDVSLVVLTSKDNLTEERQKLLNELIKNYDSPEVIFVENNNDESNLASFYKSASFFVSTHRQDSYCFDILSSMGCATPAIVTDFGAVLDYCDNDNSILVKAEKIYQKEKSVDGLTTTSYPYLPEVDLISLRVELRKAYEMDLDTYQKLSNKAYKTVVDNFTLIKINEKIKENLYALLKTPIKQNETLNVNKKILEGLNTLNSGDYSIATKILEEALKLSTENPKTNFYLGVLALQSNNINQALKYLTTAFKYDDTNDDINNYLGILLYKLNEFSYSELFFENTLELNPEHTGAIESLKAISELNIKEFTSNLDQETRNIFDNKLKAKLMKKNATLSVCILAKNEKRHIAKAIKSVKNLADEIIVLDTGSTDGTQEIALKEGAVVHSSTWENSFSKARNEVKKYATKNWILMLDADEVLSDESVERLKNLLPQLDSNKIYCPKISNILDKMAEKEIIEHYLERIIPNDPNIEYKRDIHEFPIKKDGSYVQTEVIPYIEILHYGYQNKEFVEKNKSTRNNDILTEMHLKDLNDPVNTFYLALSLKEQHNYDKSLEYSYKTIENINNSIHQHLLGLIKINILECLIYSDKLDEALEKAKEYDDTLKSRPDYYFLLGTIYFKKENYSLSKENFEKTLNDRARQDIVELDRGTVGWKSLFYIAKCYKEENDLAKSNIYLKRALKDSVNNLNIQLELLENYFKLKSTQEIELLLLNILPKLDEENSINTLSKIFGYYSEIKDYTSIYKNLEKIRKNKINNLNLGSFNNLANKMIDIYKIVLDNKDNFNAGNYSIACCLDYLGKTSEAEEIFSNLYNDDDLEVDSLHNMASLAFKKNDLDKAEELYTQVIDTDEFHIESYISLIKIKLIQNKNEEANELLVKLSKIDPDNKELSYLEFEIAKSKGDKKLASDMYASMLYSFGN